MAIFVRVDSHKNLQSYLGADVDYATWLFEKYKKEGDTMQLVTPEGYQELCERARYHEACRNAAKLLEAKAKYPQMFKKGA